jgi:hypothetical protein
MNQKTMLIASILALVLALFIFVRMTIVKHSFDMSVSASLKTSEGYDEKFITKVNNLENILATRVSFGYSGAKDPMAGTRHQAESAPAPVVAASPRPPHPVGPATVVAAPPRVVVSSDPVKLTAIIGDANDRHLTAIIMDGNKSYSVDAGDMISGRRITRITSEGVFMENASQSYYYDIYGKRQTRNKTGTQSPAQQLNH